MENIQIGIAAAEDWEAAMEVAWKTFLKYEAPVYGQKGTDSFLDFISGESLYKMFLIGEYGTVVAKIGKTVIGVASIRSKNHISLLFVDEKYHRKGIGKALLQKLQEEYLPKDNPYLSVNASPYGVPFYEKIGFIKVGSMQEADGITFQPMEIKKLI